MAISRLPSCETSWSWGLHIQGQLKHEGVIDDVGGTGLAVGDGRTAVDPGDLHPEVGWTNLEEGIARSEATGYGAGALRSMVAYRKRRRRGRKGSNHDVDSVVD